MRVLSGILKFVLGAAGAVSCLTSIHAYYTGQPYFEFAVMGLLALIYAEVSDNA